jgi:hypothetical protein
MCNDGVFRYHPLLGGGAEPAKESSVPTWDPPPDVRFDHAAAQALAGSALAVERELDQLADTTRRFHDTAAATWRGRARTRADDHLERWWFALEGAMADLAALAALVADAAEAARTEQARRSTARLRWHAEAEAERQAEARALAESNEGTGG